MDKHRQTLQLDVSERIKKFNLPETQDRATISKRRVINLQKRELSQPTLTENREEASSKALVHAETKDRADAGH